MKCRLGLKTQCATKSVEMAYYFDHLPNLKPFNLQFRQKIKIFYTKRLVRNWTMVSSWKTGHHHILADYLTLFQSAYALNISLSSPNMLTFQCISIISYFDNRLALQPGQIFFSLDRPLNKNQLLNTKCQQKFFLLILFEKRRDQPGLFSFQKETSIKNLLTFGVY